MNIRTIKKEYSKKYSKEKYSNGKYSGIMFNYKTKKHNNKNIKNNINIITNIKKKSQLSVLIILGIFLILLILIYIYFTHFWMKIEPEKETAIELENKKDPVSNYVVDCLRKTAREAIKLAGDQGGYTSLIRNNFILDQDPTESDALIFSDIKNQQIKNAEELYSKYAIPYYWFMHSPNGCRKNCEFVYHIPDLKKGKEDTSIERELEIYINENIDKCLNNFEDMKYLKYNVTILDKPETEATITNDGIIFILTYPMKARYEDNLFLLDKFYIKEKVRIKEMYELAKEITLLQRYHRFLEMMTINLISNYGSIESEIPPIVDSTFEFGSPGKIWIKTNVKNKIQELISKYTHALRVKGTRNYVELGNNDPIKQKVLDYQMRIILDKNYDFNVRFNYLKSWPIYFDLNCNGELCMAESYSNTMLVLVGNQRYNFYYTISYPVLVTISDQEAFNGEGFNYYFAMESNIRFNEPLMPGSDPFADISPSPSMLCNQNQRNSGNYTFNIIDSVTKKPVENASVYFTCGEISCMLGIAENGKFNSKLPICAEGLITIINKDYMQFSSYISTALNKSRDLGNLTLEPFREKKIRINKLKFIKEPIKEDDDSTDYIKKQWIYSGQSDLKPGQEAIVTFKKQKLSGEKEFIQTLTLSGDNQDTKEGIISLVPGIYNINVLLLDKNRILIPDDERSVGTFFLNQKFTMPGMLFNESMPFILGGLDGDFEITNEIDTAKTIVLNVISFEIGEVPENQRKVEDLQVLGKTKEFTEKYRNRLGIVYE